MKTFNNYLKKSIVFFFIGIVACVLALSATALIPQKKVIENIKHSVAGLKKEGLRPDKMGLELGPCFELDCYTDAIMLNAAAHIDKDDILGSIMRCNIFSRHDKNGFTRIDDLEHVTNHGIHEQDNITVYGRYWHGYIVFLRPLLYITQYSGIRTINIVTFSLLVLIITILSFKVIGINITLAFNLTLVFSIFNVIPLCMQYSSVFYITFAGIFLLLVNRKILNNTISAMLMFQCLGMLTSFVDLLTAPIISLCFPLVFYIDMYKDQNFKKIKKAVLLSVAWTIGYIGFWAAKWALAYMLTGENIIYNAVCEAGVHLENKTSLFELLRYIFVMTLHTPLILVFIPIIIVFFYFDKNKILNNIIYLIIAIMPLCWLLLLNEHTFGHFFFSWRNIMPSVACIILFVINTSKLRIFAKLQQWLSK